MKRCADPVDPRNIPEFYIGVHPMKVNVPVSRERDRVSFGLTVMYEICLGLRLHQSCWTGFIGWTGLVRRLCLLLETKRSHHGI